LGVDGMSTAGGDGVTTGFQGGAGGRYGGGGGGGGSPGAGGVGGVRIIWGAGLVTRAFPSTNTGDL
jgi:hypothetical protein